MDDDDGQHPAASTFGEMKASKILANPVAAAEAAYVQKRFDWTGRDWRPNLALEPRARMQLWLDETRELAEDTNTPGFAFAHEYEGGFHIVCVESPDTKAANTPQKSKKIKPLITKAIFGLTVPHAMVNVLGTLNGGLACLLVDRCTVLMMCGAASAGFWDFSCVSTSMSVTWHAPAMLGEKIEIVAEIEAVNRSTCE
jgi:hypothetical protein